MDAEEGERDDVRFALYARVSTDRQAEEGVSLDAQTARLKAWCEAGGHVAAGVFVEEGVSGAVAPDKRPVLGPLLVDLDGGVYDGLVAVALDRVSRSTKDVLALAERCRKNQWALASVREALDTSSAIGEFLLTLFASLAQLERKIIGERTRMALSLIRKRGGRFSRYEPWGRNENEVEISRFVVSEVANGFPTRFIADELNTAVGNPHPRTGKPWTARSVETLLRGIKRAEKAREAK